MKSESVMSTAKNQKWVYLAAVLLVGAGVGYLLFSGLSQNSVYFLNVSEALAMPAEKLTQARLFGSVSEKDLVHDPSAMGVSFFVQDKDDPAQAIRVHYKGAVPDTFKVGVEVILEGCRIFFRGRRFIGGFVLLALGEGTGGRGAQCPHAAGARWR